MEAARWPNMPTTIISERLIPIYFSPFSRAPIFDVPTAIDVLSTGSYIRLPTCIQNIVPPSPGKHQLEPERESFEPGLYFCFLVCSWERRWESCTEQVVEYDSLATLQYASAAAVQLCQNKYVNKEEKKRNRNTKELLRKEHSFQKVKTFFFFSFLIWFASLGDGRLILRVNAEFELVLTVEGEAAKFPWKVLAIDVLVDCGGNASASDNSISILGNGSLELSSAEHRTSMLPKQLEYLCDLGKRRKRKK